MLVFRRNRPRKVTRGSCLILNTGPLASLNLSRAVRLCSAPGTMVLNLMTLILRCRNPDLLPLGRLYGIFGMAVIFLEFFLVRWGPAGPLENGADQPGAASAIRLGMGLRPEAQSGYYSGGWRTRGIALAARLPAGSSRVPEPRGTWPNG